MKVPLSEAEDEKATLLQIEEVDYEKWKLREVEEIPEDVRYAMYEGEVEPVRPQVRAFVSARVGLRWNLWCSVIRCRPFFFFEKITPRDTGSQ